MLKNNGKLNKYLCYLSFWTKKSKDNPIFDSYIYNPCAVDEYLINLAHENGTFFWDYIYEITGVEDRDLLGLYI